jgi:hypothetical protein
VYAASFDPKAAGRGLNSEANMENEVCPAPKRRLTAVARAMRRGRIFARLREGWAYDEIAEAEQLTPERIRQIVREALERRLIDEDTDHAKLQLSRLQPALRIASEAVADGDVRAIPSFLKVLDRFDRYQRTGKVTQVYDGEARKKLIEKLNSAAANLGLLDQIKELTKGEGESELAPAESPISGGPEEPKANKENTPWGVGASP